MRRRGIEPMTENSVNVTPLIDVVMCLIIFFMICGKLAKDEMTAAGLTVPEAKLGQQIQDQRDRLVINLVPSETLPAGLDKTKPDQVAAAEDYIGRQPPKIFVRGVEKTKEQLTEMLKQEAEANKDLKVMIRADRVQHYEHVAPVLVACATAHIKSVNFSTTSIR